MDGTEPQTRHTTPTSILSSEPRSGRQAASRATVTASLTVSSPTTRATVRDPTNGTRSARRVRQSTVASPESVHCPQGAGNARRARSNEAASRTPTTSAPARTSRLATTGSTGPVPATSTRWPGGSVRVSTSAQIVSALVTPGSVQPGIGTQRVWAPGARTTTSARTLSARSCPPNPNVTGSSDCDK